MTHEKARMPPPGWCLIVGHHPLLNELLADAIRAKTGVECRATDDCSAIASAEGCVLLADDTDPAARMALLDRLASEGDAVVAALFDVDPVLSSPWDPVHRGVRGIFFASDPVPRVMTGVGTLLRGEPWIPSGSAPPSFGEAAAAQRLSRPPDPRDRLTVREREVLALLCAGSTNDQVGHQLGLSTNTVKAHLYSLYKKIGVRSRTHAALWAVRYLGEALSLTTPGPRGPGAGQNPH